MQERHMSLLQQQQVQAETLMKQMQAQIEADLRVRNDLMRNQMKMLGELQVQNPGETIDLNAFLNGIKGGQDKQDGSRER